MSDVVKYVVVTVARVLMATTYKYYR